jgi:hypothetical protein
MGCSFLVTFGVGAALGAELVDDRVDDYLAR